MDKDNVKKSIRQIVIDQIKTGQAKMRPKWHFVLKTILAVLGITILALTVLYLASFVVFVLRQTGVLFVPAFGIKGIGVFVTSLPWILILVILAFVAILEILVRRYSFAYRKPLLYSVVAIIALVIVGGVFIARIGLHQKFFRDAQNFDLPLAGPFYREFGMQRFEEIHPGMIDEITDSGFIMTNPRDESLTVIISPQTRLPLGYDFQKGDKVIVFGKRDDGTIQALGVREVEDETMMFSRKIGPPPLFSPKSQ